jgi:uncharacterized membrane protein YphA (DoxX/SURF4 family)
MNMKKIILIPKILAAVAFIMAGSMKIFTPYEDLATIDSTIKVQPIPRTEEKMGPYNFIPFLNNLAIMYKVHKAMEE